jgi:hypothetical protein
MQIQMQQMPVMAHGMSGISYAEVRASHSTNVTCTSCLI